MPNRSLDDYFAEDDEETEPTESSTADAAGTGDADPDTESDTEGDAEANTEYGTDVNTEGDAEVDTASDVDTLATYRWAPDGAPCPQCGESVEKRWLDGDEYVCIDCKDW